MKKYRAIKKVCEKMREGGKRKTKRPFVIDVPNSPALDNLLAPGWGWGVDGGFILLYKPP